MTINISGGMTLDIPLENPNKYIPQKITHLTAWATGRCDLRCKYCLPAGTKILMADFTWKNIEDVEEGDMVIGIEFGKDGKHIRMVATEVQAKLSRKDVVYRIVTDKGDLRITDNHAILSKNKRWLAIDPKKAEVPSGRIKIGTELKKFVEDVRIDVVGNGEKYFCDATVIDIIEEDEETVYNIQTGTENYIAEGFIVHNCFVYRLYPQQPSSDMSPDVWKATVEFLWNHGTEKPNLWWFGGEPMVAFESVVKPAWEYAYEKGYTDFDPYKKKGRAITWGMTTNLTLITEETAKWMGKRRFGILASIDGRRESHNTNRIYPNGKGSWDDAWRGLELVRKYINKQPQIRWSFAPNNLKYLFDDVVWYVEEEKLYNIAPDPVFEVKWGENDLIELRKVMLKFRDKMIEWMREGLPVHLKFVRDGVRPAILQERQWKSRCGLAQGGMGVDINGDLYPCHRFVASRAFKVGNVLTGFDTKSRLDLTANWIKYPPVNRNLDKCRHCIYRKACMGGCLAVNYDVYGDIHVMPDSYCDIMQVLAEVWMPFHQLMVDEGNETYWRTYVGSKAPW